jgi:hypothetical protein
MILSVEIDNLLTQYSFVEFFQQSNDLVWRQSGAQIVMPSLVDYVHLSADAHNDENRYCAEWIHHALSASINHLHIEPLRKIRIENSI